MLVIIAMFGCVLHYTSKGLLFQDNTSLKMGTSEGVEYILHVGEDAPYFTGLVGCSSEITGTKIFRHIYVDSWQITDAGDGSAPYIGLLYEQYGSLMMQDINSGHPISLVDDDRLWNLVGSIVLVTGIVVGREQIQVLGVQVLDVEK